jgi:predicted nucleic acid-binding protein
VSSVFVDTSALYALFAPSDSKHREAVGILQALQKGRAPLLTTDTVLLEAYVLVHARTGRVGLLRFRAAIGQSRWLRSIAPSSDHAVEAWRLLEQRSDKDYSFVDAQSFVIMRALGIRQAFSFDVHFAQEGFELLQGI